MKPSIQIVVPVFERHEPIRALLRQLGEQTLKPARVVIVDHGKDDLAIDYVSSFDVDIIKRPPSMWFTEATNEGIEYALQRKSDFLMILNDDVVLSAQSWLAELTNTADKENAIVASTAISQDGLVFYRGVVLRRFAFRYHAIGRGKKFENTLDEIVECDVLPTRGIIFRPYLVEKIGLLDVELPHHGSDYEWTARAKRAGIRLLISNRIYLFTSCDSVTRSRGSFQQEFKRYWNERFFKGGYAIASTYSRKVFTPTYRFFFLSVHVLRFIARYAANRLTA